MRNLEGVRRFWLSNGGRGIVKIITVLLSFVILFVCAVTGGLLFMRGMHVRGAILLAASFVLCLLALLFAFGWIKPRLLGAAGSVLLIMCVLLGISVTVQDAHLTAPKSPQAYEPFAEGSLVATYAFRDAGLRLSGPLPRINGDTAFYPMYSAFVRATYPKNDYSSDGSARNDTVRTASAQEAFRRLIAHDADLAICIAPPYSVLREAFDGGVQFTYYPVARDALVFFVPAEQRVHALTTAQLRDIFSGTVTNWKSLGGSRMAVKPYQKEEGTAVQYLCQRMMVTAPFAPAETDASGVRKAYVNTDGAIGYDFWSNVRADVERGVIQLLTVDGVEPTPAAIESMQYPYSATVFAITSAETTAETDDLIGWMQSPEGQLLAEKSGYIAVGDVASDQMN